MRVGVLPRDEVGAAIPALARLRIEVFRDWPYLYDGDMGYEERYLQAYRSAGAVVVGAWDGARLVGAATGSPMEDHAGEFGAPFVERGFDLGEVFYCAESVLLPDYRGRGLGHAFFDHREAHAKVLGRKWCCFCSVIRGDDHPMRPEGYRALDGFWRKRGYAPMDGMMAEFSWRDIGEEAETKKPLQFWIRELG